uniref:Kinesin motor domain-containing protein n=1 Tax=Ciona savignyi TaxID=51511 RepID=H2ZIV0_CIOSA
DVYEEVAEPIVQSAMQGFHGTIFAYGQTSSGKTYTMLGNTQSPGIIPLAVQDIFDMIQKVRKSCLYLFLLRVSYLEIYNENLKDLLASELVPLQIREDEFKHVRVYGLHEEMVTSPKDVMKLMAKGEKLRHMASTNMNDRSSRSHTIFKMIIESRERMDFNKTREDGTDTAVRVAQLNMVDLAGSERASQTGSEGVRLKEGCYINKSLMVLGQVINQICKDNESNSGSVFINFRDSKLTRILQPSLGGNALTVIICTVTLAVVDETDSTLRFASSAKKVKNKPTVNEVPQWMLVRKVNTFVSNFSRSLKVKLPSLLKEFRDMIVILEITKSKESMESAIEKMREDNQVMQNLVDTQNDKEEEEKLNSQLLTMDVAIGEKEKQISALEEQIKLLTDEKEQKSKEFGHLEDEISEKDERIRYLENKERNNTQKEISDAQVQIQVLETQLSEVNEKYSQLNSKYQCREPTTDSVDYGTNIDVMQVKIDELTQSLSQKNCAVENLEQTMGSLRHKTTEYREKITELERAVQGLGESNTDLMEKIDFLQKNLSEKEFQLGNVSTMCERHNKEMSEVKNRFENLSEELEQKQMECQQAQEELGVAHSKIQELDSVERGIKPDCNVSVQCETLDSSVSNALDAQEGSEDIVEGLANASDSTGNNEMLDELAAEKKLVLDLKKKVSDLEEQLGAARDRQAKVLEGCEHLSEVEQNFVTLYHQFSELSEQLKSREETNEALNQQFHDAKRDVEQMRIRLEQSIDADAAWKLEDELKALKCDLYKEKQNSEALFVRFNIVENDVDSPQQGSPEVDPDAEVVINDLKSALESKELEPKELKFGMEENKDEISHLGMIHNLKSTLESKELELEERNQLLEEMKQKLESLERNQIQESNPEFLEDLKSELESKELEIAEMKLKFESMEENINQRNDLESHLNELKSQLEEKELEIEERNRLFEEMESKLESLEEQPQQESNERSHHLEQELAQLKEELLEKELSLQLMQEKVKELQANFDSALEKEESHIASNIQLNEELANMRQRLETFATLQEEQEQVSEKLNTDYANLVEQLRLAQEDHVFAEDRLVQKEAHVTELSGEIEVLESKLASQEAMVQFLQNELTVFNEKNRVNEVLLDETKEELLEMRSEVNVLLSSVAESQEIKARHEALENELETVKNDNTSLMNEVTELKESLVKSKCEIQSLESDLKYTKTSETDALERAGLAESSIEEKQEQINDLEVKLDQAQQQVKILKDQLMEPDGDHRICEEKVSNLKEEIDILKLEHKRKINEVSALNETTKLIQEELEQVQKSLDEKTDDLHRTEEQKQIFEEELVVKTADLESSSASLEQQKRMVEALQYEISDLKCCLTDDKSELMKLLEDQENLSEVEKNFIILYQQFSQLSEEQQKLQDENENLKLKISEEQSKEVDSEVIKELEDSLAFTKLDLEEKRSKCESLTSELQLLKEELENQSKMNEAKLNELKSELEQNFTCSDKMNKLLQNLEELQENCDQKDAENKTLAEDVAHLHQASQRAQEEFQLLVEGKENEISSLKSELNCLQSEMKAS